MALKGDDSMNKIMLFLVVVLSLTLFLAGCGEAETTEPATPAEVTTSETTTETTVEVTEETLEEATPIETLAEGEEATEAAVETEEETGDEAATDEESLAEADYTIIDVEGCTDTDGGLNYDLAGSVTDVDGITDDDYCSVNENYSGKLYETYCEEDGTHGRETYNCPSGACELGACVAQTAEDAATDETMQ